MRTLLWGRRAVFLWNLFPFAGERPFAVEGLRLFADGFGNLLHLQVFEYVHTELARACQVHIAIVVEIGGNELSAGTGFAVDGNFDAGEGDGGRTVCDLHR